LQLYLRRNWPIFPCRWDGSRAPLTPFGFKSASRDPGVVADWSRRFPRAFWALRTGRAPMGSDVAVVDLDRKNGKDGFRTFAELTGSSELPATPRVHTPHTGTHLYFRAPPGGCHSVTDPGSRRRPGLGSGIDFKCDLAQAHLPGGPMSPYRWDDEFNLVTIPQLMMLPAVLTPVEIRDAEDEMPPRERRPAINNLDNYARAALTGTCDRIRSTPPGGQRKRLNDESLQMGNLAAGLGLDHQTVVDALVEAGLGMQNEWGKPPWTRHDIKKTVQDGFRDGLRKPYQPRVRGRR
jgi:hypothetical protein